MRKNIEDKALALVNQLNNYAMEGVKAGPFQLASSAELAEEYENDPKYKDADARVKALIRWETTKNFTTGFLTGVGGIITLPVAIPAALGTSWIIQTRMVGAIAILYGHDLNEDRVRTLAGVAFLGNSAKRFLKTAGIQVGERLARNAVGNIPGRALIEINKRVGMRLVTKTGQKGVINLAKGIPFVGGAVGGMVDGAMCLAIGKAAQTIFRPDAGIEALDKVGGDNRKSKADT